MRIRIHLDIKVGRIVKYLVLTDLFLLLGWGFIEPVFSVFIVQRIAGATLVTVGFATALYWILKSIIELPVANYLDRDRPPGEKRDFTFIIGGLVLAGLSAFSFAWISETWQLYLAQAVHALAFALYIPAWSSIFSRHLDHDRVAFDWSLDSTVAGFASGFSGLVAGITAASWGFQAVFIAGGVFSLISAIVIMTLPDIVLPKPAAAGVQMKDKTPAAAGI